MWTRCGKTGKVQETLLSIARKWPTPDASAVNLSEPLETWLARREKLKAKGINGNGAGMPLGIAVRLWPTPVAADSDKGGTRYGSGNLTLRGAAIEADKTGGLGLLNPSWVEWLMGFPIGWTGCVVLAMHRSPSKQQQPSADSWPL